MLRGTRLPIMAVLALAGLAVSLLLVYQHHHPYLLAQVCSEDSGCAAVLTSRYASVAGVPLALVGAAYYAAVLCSLILLVGLHGDPMRRRIWLTVRMVLWVAAAASGGLMALQIFAIGALCVLCTTSAVLTFALLALTFARPDVDRPADPAAALALGVLVLLLTAGATIFLRVRPAPYAEVPLPPATRPLELNPALGHAQGPEDAPAHIVVFSDFQCPFCAVVAEQVHALREEFPDDLRVSFYHFPLRSHPRAREAATAAECAARHGRFWAFHDRLFSRKGDIAEVDFPAVAAELGIDKGAFVACMSDPAVTERVDASRRLALSLGFDAAPVLLLNGQHLGGLLPYEQLRALVARSAQASQSTPVPVTDQGGGEAAAPSTSPAIPRS